MTMRKLALLLREVAFVLQEEGAGLHGGIERLAKQNSHFKVSR